MGANIVIAVTHWGIEYTSTPTADQKKWAHFLVDSGVDAVISGHAHVVQPNELYKGKNIVYSMGNFIFDGMEGDALNGQMVALTIHASMLGVAKITVLKNIPIKIGPLGLPSLK